MKRKINKVGQNTLTVSLPATWAKKHDVKAGDELELNEEGNKIILQRDKKREYKELMIDVSGMGNMINRVVAAIYKSGVNKLTLKYSTSEELKTIEKTVYRACHVFEMIDISKDKIKIKAISELDENNFDQVLKKIGFSIIDFAKETLNCLKKQEYDNIPSIILKDRIVDRHTDFCRRLINRGIDSGLRPGPLYAFVENSEIAADIFKNILKDFDKEKKQIEPELVKLFEKIINMIKAIYSLQSQIKKEKIKQAGLLEKEINKDIDSISKKIKSHVKLYGDLINLFRTTFEMKGSILTMNIEKIN